MDSARRNHAPPPRSRRRHAGPRGRFALTRALAALVAAATACSGLTDNADGINTIDLRLPTNLYLEVDRTVTLEAVARNAKGDSVAAAIRFLTADTTITVGETTGVVTGRRSTGTGSVRMVAFGTDSIVARDSLTFTLTARADTLAPAGTDTVQVAVDTIGTTIGASLQGGSPRAAVAGRPITFRLIAPAASDSSVGFGRELRSVDSSLTQTTGQASVTVRGRPGRVIPDRAIIDITAYRADGQTIPGSGRRVVVVFRHGSS